MLTDTHAHLYYPEMIDVLPDILKRAGDAGIDRVIVPAVNLETSITVIELCRRYRQIYCAIGIHPCDVSKSFEGEFEKIKELVHYEKVVAIGETGLDYYWDTSNADEQKEFFRKHIWLASELKLPIVIHTRESTEDAIAIVKEEFDKHPVRAHFHCFSGTSEQLKDCLAIPEAHVSFCGNITYKNSTLDEIVLDTPTDRLLSETDSPFLPPVPYRGKKNEPSFMIKTIDRIAELKGIEPSRLKEILSENAVNFFAMR